MNKEIKNFLYDKNIIIKKITIKGSVFIITDVDNNMYVIKKINSDIDKIYDYLSSRSFLYYPKLLYKTDNYYIFEYVKDVDMSFEERASDIVKLTSLLHSKSTFYKDIDDDYYKEIYEDINNRLDYLFNYYEDVVSIIESEEFMSPSNYLFVRNVTKLFQSIMFAKDNINKWYDIIDEKKRVRVCNIHNNLDISHYIAGMHPVLISWDKSKKDIPIYDLVKFYKKYYDKLDFCDLLNIYDKNYPLLYEEKLLFVSLISIPDKVIFNDNEYEMCNIIKKFYNYILDTDKFIYDLMPQKETNITKK